MARFDKIILVYNADSGTLNAVKDSLKKAFGRSECALCDLTHGLAGERKEWTACTVDLGIPIEYLHRDELTPQERAQLGTLPCVLAESRGKRTVLVTKAQIAALEGDPEKLVALIKRRS